VKLSLRIGKKWAKPIVSRTKIESRLSAVCTKEKRRIYNETLDIFSFVCYYIGNNIRAYCGFSPFFGACGGIPSSPCTWGTVLSTPLLSEPTLRRFWFSYPFYGRFAPVNSAKTNTPAAWAMGAVAIANAFGCVPPGPLRERKTYAGGHRTQCRVAFASYFL
jgi:hypothetical protein